MAVVGINNFVSDIAVFVLKRDVKLQPTGINNYKNPHYKQQ